MQNYPGVWSLPSIQYTDEELPDHLDLKAAQRVFDRLSDERFEGKILTVKEYLTSGTCSDNPMDERVTLRLYRFSAFEKVPLNPDYYTDAMWLTPEMYQRLAEGQLCGLCVRLWSDWLHEHEGIPRFALGALSASPRSGREGHGGLEMRDEIDDLEEEVVEPEPEPEPKPMSTEEAVAEERANIARQISAIVSRASSANPLTEPLQSLVKKLKQ
jgi:hypothetical protein